MLNEMTLKSFLFDNKKDINYFIEESKQKQYLEIIEWFGYKGYKISAIYDVKSSQYRYSIIILGPTKKDIKLERSNAIYGSISTALKYAIIHANSLYNEEQDNIMSKIKEHYCQEFLVDTKNEALIVKRVAAGMLLVHKDMVNDIIIKKRLYSLDSNIYEDTVSVGNFKWYFNK